MFLGILPIVWPFPLRLLLTKPENVWQMGMSPSICLKIWEIHLCPRNLSWKMWSRIWLEWQVKLPMPNTKTPELICVKSWEISKMWDLLWTTRFLWWMGTKLDGTLSATAKSSEENCCCTTVESALISTPLVIVSFFISSLVGFVFNHSFVLFISDQLAALHCGARTHWRNCRSWR